MLPRIEKKPFFPPEEKKTVKKEEVNKDHFVYFLTRSDEQDVNAVFVAIELENHKTIFEWFRNDATYKYVYDYVDFMLQKGTEKIIPEKRNYNLYIENKIVEPDTSLSAGPSRVMLTLKTKPGK